MVQATPSLTIDVESEADVELKIINPLLTDPNYLAVRAECIKAKGYLPAIELDKASGKSKGYYPDYSVWQNTLPILIVEAKAPTVAADIGYREACLYARHLNQLYRHNINPCQLVISCNGSSLLAGHWDSQPELKIEVSDLVVGSSALESLKYLCHGDVIAAIGDDFLKQLRAGKLFRPFNAAGGQAIVNAKKPFNTFAAELSPILRRYFTSTGQNTDRDIYERGYVNSEDATEYDKILELLLKDRITTRRGSLSQDLEPTRAREPKLAAAISAFKANPSVDGQLQLITGGVGSGKSLFVRRFKELLLPNEEREDTHWAFIDYNTAPVVLEAAEGWLCQKFIESFQAERAGFDVYDGENLSKIFSRDLQKKKGIYAELAKISKDTAALRRIEDLQSWQEDPLKMALGICRHFSGDRGHVVVVVMDNVDRLELKTQLAAFQLSLWFMDQTKAFVILQMRDETYERFKNRPPLDTYRSGVNFHISPPRFLDVVKRRLELSLEFLSKSSDNTLTYYLKNGAKITYPKTMIGEYLKGVYLELFENNHNISRVLQGLAGRDVRKALEMFVSILNSGHLREEAITSVAKGAGSIAIEESVILKILMRTEYSFFSEFSGFIHNIFYVDEHWHMPNSFVIVDILFWLCERRKTRGQIGLEGYFAVEIISDELQLRGHVREDVLSACKWMLEKLLIEADHINHLRLDLDDCVKVTASGFIHMRVLCEQIEYIYGILVSTPLFDQRTASQIGEFVRIESMHDEINLYQQVRCVDLFLVYLKRQYDLMKSSFPDFGGMDTGASYAIKQINSALGHFRNPAGRQIRSQNILDVL